MGQADSVGAKSPIFHIFLLVAVTPSNKSSINTNRKQYEIGCQLLLITNSKLYTGFGSIPSSMTLNDLERRNSPYFAFFPLNSTALLANYIAVIEDRPIMSVNVVSQFQSCTFGHN